MLPHTGLFLLWKVALQMRIRRRLKTDSGFQTTFYLKFNQKKTNRSVGFARENLRQTYL